MRFLLALLVLVGCSSPTLVVSETSSPRVVVFFNTSQSCAQPEALTVIVEGEARAEVAPGSSYELVLEVDQRLLARGDDGIVRAVRWDERSGIAYRGCAHPSFLAAHEAGVSLRVINHPHACEPGGHTTVRWLLDGKQLAQLSPGTEVTRYVSVGLHRWTRSSGEDLSHGQLSIQADVTDTRLVAGCTGAVGIAGDLARLTVMRRDDACESLRSLQIKVAGGDFELAPGQGLTRILPLGAHILRWRVDDHAPQSTRITLGRPGVVWRPPCP